MGWTWESTTLRHWLTLIGYFLSTVCDRRNYVNWSTFGSGITEVRIITNLQQRPRARRTARVCHRCRWEWLEADTKVVRGQFKYGPKKSLQAFPHGLQVCTFRHKLSKTVQLLDDSSTTYDNQKDVASKIQSSQRWHFFSYCILPHCLDELDDEASTERLWSPNIDLRSLQNIAEPSKIIAELCRTRLHLEINQTCTESQQICFCFSLAVLKFNSPWF